MEMNMLSLLMPALQTGVATPGQGKGTGMPPHPGFAGLLAMLQGSSHTGPEKAMAALLLAQQSGEESAMALPFLQLLPQLLSANTGADEDSDHQELYAQAALPALSLVQLSEMTAHPGSFTESADQLSETAVSQAGTILDAGTANALPPAFSGHDEAAMHSEQMQAEVTTHDAGPRWQLHLSGQGEPAGDDVQLPVDAAPQDGVPEKGNEQMAVDNKAAQSGSGPTAEKNAAQAENMQRVRPERREILVERARPETDGHQPLPFRAALQTPAATTAPSQISRAAIAEQVLEKMVFTKEADGDTTLFVRLRPAALGDVEIRLRMEAGRLTASIITENAHVKEALDATLGQIRHRLEAQQIHVAEITVTVGQEQNFKQGREPQSPWRSQQRGSRYRTMDVEEGQKQATTLLSGLVDIRA